jgi:hypothetical protein
MLNIRVNLARINGRIKRNCPNHPRYNPEKAGQAGIRGGCAQCTEMWFVYENYFKAVDALKTLNIHIDLYGQRYSKKKDPLPPAVNGGQA